MRGAVRGGVAVAIPLRVRVSPLPLWEPVAQLESERDRPKVEVASSILAGFICQRDATLADMRRLERRSCEFDSRRWHLCGRGGTRHTHDVESVGFGGSNPLVHTLRAAQAGSLRYAGVVEVAYTAVSEAAFLRVRLSPPALVAEVG